MAVSLTEYLSEIQELTKKNLEILKALNDSFYTKSEHLSVNIDNTDYVIPSFISLENKLNTLEDNFENLVNAPRTGEAVFDFNGNTQSIEVKGFTNVPKTAFEDVDVKALAANMKSFGYKKNEVFKDFLTPTPFVKVDLSQIPSDIHQVNVKKMIVKNEQLLSLLKQDAEWVDTETVCAPINYADVVKKIYPYEEGLDYVVYDKLYTMPVRYEIGSGKYSIKEIKNNWTDDNFFEHYELVLDSLTYKVADETIEKNFFVGDYLITNNDKVKLLIEKIYSSSNTVQVKVENGCFADLCTEKDGNVDLSTLKFFAIGNIKEQKYLEVPLEEDQYVLIFLAPIQRNSLVQSAWSTGLFFNVFGLTNDAKQSYKDFYDTMVTNIGDKLFGIVAMASEDLVNISEDEFNTMTQAKPVIDTEAIKVTLINKHMSNSETISEIYNLYNQKEDYKLQLNSVQKQIDEINNLLSSLSFEDTTTSRTIYEDQLADLNEKKKNLTSSIANCIQQITIASTDTDTPVENPKYHIRGFFDYEKFLKDNGWLIRNGQDVKYKHNIIKIEVQYRYKNANRTTGNAETIGKDGAIFSDWNIMDSFTSIRKPVFNGANYVYELDKNTTKINIPSFNQIDIPISQGETVDLRLKVIYSEGFPFIRTESDWSEIVNIEFPVELRKNITVLDILKENNSDTTKEAFRGYLEKYGVIEHVSDKLVDQNISYFHQPEHIASGFYTEERRVIPLRDKLQTLTNDIVTLKDEVYGTSSDNLLVTLSDGENEIIVNPFAENTFILKDFSSSDKITSSNNDVMPKVETTLTLKIQNNSKTSAIKLFSMFPGNYNNVMKSNTQSKYNPKEYTYSPLSYIDFDKESSVKYSTGTSKLLSSLPGNSNKVIKSNEQNKYNLKEYNSPVGNITFDKEIFDKEIFDKEISDKEISDTITGITNTGICVPIYIDDRDEKTPFDVQHLNQWLYFRCFDAYNHKDYYKTATEQDSSTYTDLKIVGYHENYKITESIAKIIYPTYFKKELGGGMCAFPHITTQKDICITETDNINYKIIYPGESLEIPITVMYSLNKDVSEITKTMAFDLRNSLYNDPLNFKFNLKAKYSNSLANNIRKLKKVRYNPVVIN